MGAAGRLSAGRAKLRRSAFRTGKIDGTRTQAKARRRTTSGSCQTEETRPQILIGPPSTVPQIASEHRAAPFARFNRCRPACTMHRRLSVANGEQGQRQFEEQTADDRHHHGTDGECQALTDNRSRAAGKPARIGVFTSSPGKELSSCPFAVQCGKASRNTIHGCCQRKSLLAQQRYSLILPSKCS